MRIAFCANGNSPHAVRWANAVADRGHHVAFVWAKTTLAGADLAVFRPSITHHSLAPEAFGIRWPVPRQLSAARRLARRIDPELAHGFYLSGDGLAAHALGVRPLVLTALGSDVADLERRDGLSPLGRLKNAIRVRRTRAAASAADVICTDSTTLAARIAASIPGAETRVIRFGVELATIPSSARSAWRSRLEIGNDAFVILSSRLVRPLYNIDTIIRALPGVRQRVPGAILVVKELERFGDAVYRRRCIDLVADLGLEDAVRTVGELNSAELLELHTAADVFVSVPSTDGTAVSVLEAMAAGVAIVATDAPGIDPVILRHEDTALLVPPRDPVSLAESIVRLFDPPCRQALAARAFEAVSQYGDWNRELDRAVALYEELLSGASRVV